MATEVFDVVAELRARLHQRARENADQCAKLDQRIIKLETALEEIRNIAEGRADVDQKGDSMVPNTWMQVQVICDEAVK